jgi:hypothetical protein
MPDLTVPQLAKRLGATRAGLHYHIHAGRLEASRTIDGNFRITPEAAERFIAGWHSAGDPLTAAWRQFRRHRAATEAATA